MKTKLFSLLFALLALAVSAASAKIDLTPYEVPNSTVAQFLVIQPGLFLVLNDSGMNNGAVPDSVVLLQDGQTLFSKEFDENGEWQLFSIFQMNENCYGYILDKHGDLTLGRQFVRLTSAGPSLLLQLPDHCHSIQLMDFGVAFLYETDTVHALRLLDWQGNLKVDYALDPLKPHSLFDSALLADGTLRVLMVDTGETPAVDSGNMMLRTFSNTGELLSEQVVQSPYIGGHNDTVAFDSDGGLVVCTAPLADYKIQQIIRMDAQNNVLYQKTLSAPKTVVGISAAHPLPDGSVTLYGTAMANSRGLFTAFKLDLDAQGNIAALDIRDFTTRATYLYDVDLDVQGNVSVVARDYQNPIAVVPFEVLPAHSDPGLTLE